MENAKKEKKAVQDELAMKALDIEAMQLEIEALKDEKEELINQMKMGSEINENDAIHALGEEELRS